MNEFQSFVISTFATTITPRPTFTTPKRLNMHGLRYRGEGGEGCAREMPPSQFAEKKTRLSPRAFLGGLHAGHLTHNLHHLHQDFCKSLFSHGLTLVKVGGGG